MELSLIAGVAIDYLSKSSVSLVLYIFFGKKPALIIARVHKPYVLLIIVYNGIVFLSIAISMYNV